MPSRQAVSAAVGEHWAQRWVRLARWVLLALYVPVTLLGVAVVTPTVMVTVTVVVTGFAGVGLIAGLVRVYELPGPDRRTRTITGSAAAGIVPFSEGVDLLQEAGTVIGATVLLLLALVGNHWWAHNLTVSADPSVTRPAVGGPLREWLAGEPVESLFREWRALQPERLPVDARHVGAAAQVRSLLLDELERRDPVGFGRWLSEGAVAPPEQHIRGDQGPAA